MADFTRNGNNLARPPPWFRRPPIPLHHLPPFSPPFLPQSTFGPIFPPTPQVFINPPPPLPPVFASFLRPPATPFPNATPSGPGPYGFTQSASRFFTPYSYHNLPPPPPPPQPKGNAFLQSRTRGQHHQWQQNQNLAYRPAIFGPVRGTGVFHSPQINHLPNNNINPIHKKNKPRKRRGRRNKKGGGVEASPEIRNVNCSKGDDLGKQEERPQPQQHVPNYEMVLPNEWPYSC